VGDKRGVARGFIVVEGELARSRDDCERSTTRILWLVATARSTHSVEGRSDEAVPPARQGTEVTTGRVDDRLGPLVSTAAALSERLPNRARLSAPAGVRADDGPRELIHVDWSWAKRGENRVEDENGLARGVWRLVGR
jgi:hypothetical protein